MSGEYKVLLDGATTTGVSPHLPFTEGRGTVIVQGTFPPANGDDDDDDNDSVKIDIECSYDGTTFVPIQGLTDIEQPIAISFELAHKVHIRANVKETKAGHTPSITVVVC